MKNYREILSIDDVKIISLKPFSLMCSNKKPHLQIRSYKKDSDKTISSPYSVFVDLYSNLCNMG